MHAVHDQYYYTGVKLRFFQFYFSFTFNNSSSTWCPLSKLSTFKTEMATLDDSLLNISFVNTVYSRFNLSIMGNMLLGIIGALLEHYYRDFLSKSKINDTLITLVLNQRRLDLKFVDGWVGQHC